MIPTFDAYFEWLIPWEGSAYENVAGDPGGPTKYGIDQRSHPTINIRALTKEKAKEIYRKEYWNAVAADKLPPRTAWAVVDCAVNCGRHQAAKWLQECSGSPADGRIGPVTISGAARFGNDAKLAAAILERRAGLYQFLARNRGKGKFLKGWLNRNNALRKEIA